MSALTDLRSSTDLLRNLTQREIKGKYKRTALGQLWSLVNPIAIMATYSIVFAFLLKNHPAAGDPSGLDVFALWLSCALLPWMFFTNVMNSGMASILGNVNLIQKVYFPREVLVLSSGFSWLFTFAIEMLVLFVAIVLFGGSPWLYLPGVIVFVVLLTAFGLGISFLLAVANVYFRDTAHFVAIATQLWFYATPIVYPVSIVTREHPGLARYYRLNPMERFSEVFRNLLYDNRWPSFTNTLYVLVLSLGLLVIGYSVFRHYAPRLAEEL